MSPGTTSANAYLRTKVLTANPEELRLMLLDGAIKFARQGRDGLIQKDFEASYNGITQCRNIILELINTIREEFDPDLCGKVKALYTFLYTELVEASMAKSIERVDKVIGLLQYERDTWALLIEKLADERASGGGAPASLQANTASAPSPKAYAPLSLQA